MAVARAIPVLLMLAAAVGALEQCRGNVALQRGLGVASELLTPAQIQTHLAALVTHDLLGGTFCADDGSADPYSMLAMMLPMVLFYEVAIIVGRLMKK